MVSRRIAGWLLVLGLLVIPVALRAQGPTVTVGSNVAEEQICAASGRWPR